MSGYHLAFLFPLSMVYLHVLLGPQVKKRRKAIELMIIVCSICSHF